MSSSDDSSTIGFLAATFATGATTLATGSKTLVAGFFGASFSELSSDDSSTTSFLAATFATGATTAGFNASLATTGGLLSDSSLDFTGTYFLDTLAATTAFSATFYVFLFWATGYTTGNSELFDSLDEYSTTGAFFPFTFIFLDIPIDI